MEQLAKPFWITICTPDFTKEALVYSIPPVGTILRVMKVGYYRVTDVEFVGYAVNIDVRDEEKTLPEPMEPLIRCVLAKPEEESTTKRELVAA